MAAWPMSRVRLTCRKCCFSRGSDGYAVLFSNNAACKGRGRARGATVCLLSVMFGTEDGTSGALSDTATDLNLKLEVSHTPTVKLATMQK